MNIIKYLAKRIIPEQTRLNIRFLIHKTKSFRYYGNKVTCNCCNKKFSKFLSYGLATKRLNAICPWCMSLERTRMLWDFLCKSSFLSNNSKVLHIAPSQILEKRLKSISNIDYRSGDINPALAMEVVDITNIQYSNNCFDIIICSHVLSDVKDDILALNEMYRVLKKGAVLILQETIFEKHKTTFENFSLTTPEERLESFGNPHSLRCYGEDFITRISSTGFIADEYNHTKTLTQQEIELFGMQNSGSLFICKK